MHVYDRYCGVFTDFPIAGDGSVRHYKNYNIVKLTCLTVSGAAKSEFEQTGLLMAHS